MCCFKHGQLLCRLVVAFRVGAEQEAEFLSFLFSLILPGKAVYKAVSLVVAGARRPAQLVKMTFQRWWTQFKAMNVKNYVYRKRHWVQTLCEIIVPLLIILILACIRPAGKPFLAWSNWRITIMTAFPTDLSLSLVHDMKLLEMEYGKCTSDALFSCFIDGFLPFLCSYAVFLQVWCCVGLQIIPYDNRCSHLPDHVDLFPPFLSALSFQLTRSSM